MINWFYLLYVYIRDIYRYYSWKCMDCGANLSCHPLTARGDVCCKCFDEFDGLSIDELLR